MHTLMYTQYTVITSDTIVEIKCNDMFNNRFIF